MGVVWGGGVVWVGRVMLSRGEETYADGQSNGSNVRNGHYETITMPKQSYAC